MRKNVASEQMLYIVRQAESGTPLAEVCRKVRITEQTFYKSKRRVAGMWIAGRTRKRVQYAYIEKPKIDQTSLRQPKASRTRRAFKTLAKTVDLKR